MSEPMTPLEKRLDEANEALWLENLKLYRQRRFLIWLVIAVGTALVICVATGGDEW